jgi:hypothetical protein
MDITAARGTFTPRATRQRQTTFNRNTRAPKIDLPDGVTKCRGCDDNGHAIADIDCDLCGGVGYHGISTGPCAAPKGSLLRTLVYRARYQAGKRLYHRGDSPDHPERPNNLNHDGGPVPWTVPEVTDWDDED